MKFKDQFLLESAYDSILKNTKTLKEDFDEVDVLEVEPEHPPFSKNHLEEKEEQEMAKSNLYSICKHAKSLLDAVENGTSLEPWQLEKIAVVNDNIQSVSQVAEYDHHVNEYEEPYNEAKEVNPYAVCTATVGRENEEKYKRCKKDVAKGAKKYGKKITSKKVKTDKK